MGSKAPPTAFDVHIQAESQSGGPGLESKTKTSGVWTQNEYWDADGKPYLKEYEGRDLLKGKKVIITGGDSGIGRSVAILMAREGADITVHYLEEEEEDAQWTKQQIEKAGRKAHLVTGNLREEANVKKLIDEHLKAHGKLNVLVNNASMQEMCEDFKDINLDVVEKTLRTNLWQMMAMTKYALPHLHRGDSIINTSSVAGYMGNPQLVDYSATKGGIATFTRALAQQTAKDGIRVNAVAPGIIWTPLQTATKGNPAEAMKDLGIEDAPLGRAGFASEVGPAYVFLASPLGAYMTGETIHTTGGIEMQG